VKHFLNRTLTVKQILALIILPVALGVTTWAFSTAGNPAAMPAAGPQGDSLPLPTAFAAPDTTPVGRLRAYVDSISSSAELQGGSWSFCLVDGDSGQPVCAVDVDRGLVPASVIKIVTTGTALAILGPGYRFSTTLQYDGTIDPATRTLNGNIYIHGAGDPSLGSQTFGSSVSSVVEKWAAAIRALGIDSIAGCVIGDAEAFERDPVPGGWAWEDIQSGYGAAPCGLNIRENMYDLDLTPSGGGVIMRTSPVIPGLKLYNQVTHNPAIAKSYAYVAGAPFQFERTVLGEISAQITEHSSIPDPALFCAQKLKESLSESGVAIRDSATTLRLVRLNRLKPGAKEGRTAITTISSPPLADLVYHTNQVSQNFYAETFLKALGMRQNGYGSTSGGVSVIYNYWKSKGLDLRGLCMVDGSGVSRFNTVTTRQLTEMLRVYARDSVLFPVFYRSLPTAGESGTIRKLAGGTAAAGNVHAKSGTMSRVRAYAGYVYSKSHKVYCFAVIGNNTLWDATQLRDKFERLFVLMAELD
jgi:D-alanyl-D-alanine carboxypeptidase/D-alanyl-D-alanine-endopeptidase (penicillin-binding protein 4)